jgi:uncharacterized cupredoxin-like copper-binding protein
MMPSVGGIADMEDQMKLSRFVVPCFLALAVTATPALARTHIKVTLNDNGENIDLSKGMGLGVGMGGDMKKSPMSVTLDKATVKAGKVTFDVVNASKGTVHEVIISPIANLTETMPYINSENRVDEDHGSHLGEVSELDPGQSGGLTITLKPGLYLVYCNIPQHFMDGMWTTLTVTK